MRSVEAWEIFLFFLPELLALLCLLGFTFWVARAVLRLWALDRKDKAAWERYRFGVPHSRER